MDDRELSELLREWKAPSAPARLRPPHRRHEPWWRWLLTGDIRIPVPVALATALIVALWVVWPARGEVTTAPPSPVQAEVSLADFEPVAEVELRVVGGGK